MAGILGKIDEELGVNFREHGNHRGWGFKRHLPESTSGDRIREWSRLGLCKYTAGRKRCQSGGVGNRWRRGSSSRGRGQVDVGSNEAMRPGQRD